MVATADRPHPTPKLTQLLFSHCSSPVGQLSFIGKHNIAKKRLKKVLPPEVYVKEKYFIKVSCFGSPLAVMMYVAYANIK